MCYKIREMSMELEVTKKKVSRKLSPFVNQDAQSTFSDYLAQKGSSSPLRKIRKSRGFTLQRLAEASGISASYLSRIEARARRMNEEVISRLCTVLDCMPGELLSALKPNGTSSTATTSLSHAFASDLPVYAVHATNDGKSIIELDEKKEWVFRPAELTAESAAFAVRVCNDYNSPKYRINDVLYVNPSKTLNIGMPVLSILKNKQLVIGELISNNNDSIVIKSFKPNSATMTYDITEMSGLYFIQFCAEGHAK